MPSSSISRSSRSESNGMASDRFVMSSMMRLLGGNAAALALFAQARGRQLGGAPAILGESASDRHRRHGSIATLAAGRGTADPASALPARGAGRWIRRGPLTALVESALERLILC